MKKMLFAILILLTFGAYAQTVQVGTGNETDKSLPMDPYYGNSYSQSIFLQSELDLEGKQIEKIYYQFNKNSEFSDDIEIYLGHTDKTDFADITSWLILTEPETVLTKVFSGQMNTADADEDGWIEITLTTPFIYNNSDNLLVAFDENSSSYHNASDEFYCSATPDAADMSINVHSDTVNPDPLNPPSSSPYVTKLSAFRPNIRFDFGSIPTGPVIALSDETYAFGEVNIGQEKLFEISIANMGATDLIISSATVAAPFSCSFGETISPGASSTAIVIFTPVTEDYSLETLTFNITGEFTGTQTVDLSGSGFSLPESMVQIGMEKLDNHDLPLTALDKCSYSQSLFLQSELNIADKVIDELYYQYSGSEVLNEDIAVYMGHTADNEISDWVPVTQLTKVFEGAHSTAASGGWLKITLDKPFIYNNSDNLVIALNKETSNVADIKFYSSATPTDFVMSKQKVAYTPINPATPYSGDNSAFRPNVRLNFSDIPQSSAIVLSEDSHDFGTVYGGEEATLELTITNNGFVDLVITDAAVAAPFSCSYSGTIAPDASETVTVRFNPTTAGTVTEVLTFNISNDDTGINVIELSGDGFILPAGLKEIGREKLTDKGLPMEPFFGFSYSQSLFLQSELNVEGGTIEKLYYQYNGNSAWETDIVIYLGHTTETTVTDWVALSGLTEVYNGTFSVPDSEGWIEIVLDAPFSYNNTDNLIIAFDENNGNYDNGSDEFYCSATPDGAVMSINYRNDNINPDPADPSITGTKSAFRPNIRVQFDVVPAPEAVIALAEETYAFAMTDIGTEKTFDLVITNNGDADLVIESATVAAPFTCDYSGTIAAGATGTATISFKPTAVALFTETLTFNITGNFSGTNTIEISGEGVTSSGIEKVIPEVTTLYQNYPNPFNPNTSIKFFNKLNGNVNLSIYNVKGEMVASLLNKDLETGFQHIQFDASHLNSGLYYYKLTTPEKSIIKKMMMVK